MISTTRTTVLTMGQHRGNPRIYLEGRWLITAGFVPGGCYAKGNGFQPLQLTAEDTTCPTIKKRYFAGQGDNVVVRHPRLPDHHRWLTLPEVRRLMGLPEDYSLGDTLTNAGEVLGQGVQVDTFTQIIRSVTRREVPS